MAPKMVDEECLSQSLSLSLNMGVLPQASYYEILIGR